MGKKSKDLTGMKFGRLTVIKPGEIYVSLSGRKRKRWYCNCDCGTKNVLVLEDNLRRNHTKSCGCYVKERQFETFKKYNKYDLSGDFGIGYTSKNEEFYFDLEDYDLIKDYCWCKDKQGYIITDHNKKRIYMHRLIMLDDIDKNVDIDHIGHILHDNRKKYLRICNESQNMRNSNMHKNNTSGVSGVWWFSDRNKWVAEIRIYRKKIHLGYFDNLNDAIKARKDAEDKYFGEWSFDNSINKYNELEKKESITNNDNKSLIDSFGKESKYENH